MILSDRSREQLQLDLFLQLYFVSINVVIFRGFRSKENRRDLEYQFRVQWKGKRRLYRWLRKRLSLWEFYLLNFLVLFFVFAELIKYQNSLPLRLHIPLLRLSLHF